MVGVPCRALHYFPGREKIPKPQTRTQHVSIVLYSIVYITSLNQSSRIHSSHYHLANKESSVKRQVISANRSELKERGLSSVTCGDESEIRKPG